MSQVKTPGISRMGMSIGESATLRQAARVGELRGSGRRIFNFTLGEPDCETPQLVLEAAHRAIDEGYTHYTPSAGLPELRQALAEYYSRWHGVAWEARETIVSVGAKQVLWNALAAVVEPEDEVVLFSPYWTSYVADVEMLRATARVVHTTNHNGFKATGDDLRAVLGPKTKAVLFNNPVNPTGAVYSRSELEDLFAPLVDRGIYIISDEIYERLIFEGEHVTPLKIYPQLRERFLVATGASKSFAMTGWRIGFGLGPFQWIQAMLRLQSHVTGNANSVAQRAALAALQLPEAELRQMCARFQSRRDLCLDVLARLPQLTIPRPAGAFYVFLDVRSFYGTWQGGKQITSSKALAEHLLEKHGVAVVPGEAFNYDGGIRISYTVGESELREGLEILIEALRRRA